MRRAAATRSIVPVLAIAAFGVLLIGAIAMLTAERISYERGVAVEEATRINANLALAFEDHVLRSLRSADLALQLARRELQAGGRNVNLSAVAAESALDARLVVEFAVLDERGRVVLSAGQGPALDLGGAELLARHRADPQGGLQVDATAFALSSGIATIRLSRPIANRDGSLGGAVLVDLAPGYFSAFGRRLDPARASMLLPAAYTARAGNVVSNNPDGMPRYVSYRVLEAYPFLVAVGAGVEETLAPFRVRERGYVRNAWLATVAVLLFAASLIAAWVVLDRSGEQFRQLAGHIPEAFWMTDLKNERALYLSPAFAAVSGLPRLPLAEAWQAWMRLIPPQDRARALAFYSGGEDLDPEFEHRIVRPDGAERWVRARAFAVRDATGERYRLAGTLEDVTERRKAEERLQHDAQFDSVTELPNRLVCRDRLGQALVQARRKDWGVAVLYIDLDRFKTVNDMLGHAVGDGVLRQAGQRLARCVRAGDTVARIGGDEFAVVLAEIAHPDDAGAVAQKVIDAMAPPMEVEGHEVFISVSVGIAAYPADGADGETLLKNADAAMFKAKQVGRATYQYYTAAMNERAMEKLLLENDLRRALERDEFRLYYQPKLDLKSGRIAGLEALLRWEHPRHGVMAPSQFVPLLEDSGLIVQVGDWVVRAACRQVREWLDAGVPAVPVAVNLSARQFLHHDLLGVIERALEVGIDPRLLALEITESDIMQRPEEVIAMLHRVKARGIAISIDDFGTGYSSLAYVKRLPIDALKIDRSFVTGLPGNRDDAAIARTVIAMAHSLGLKVIAEGVETEAQRAFLAEQGCDQLQGYLISKALAPGDCAAALRANAT